MNKYLEKIAELTSEESLAIDKGLASSGVRMGLGGILGGLVGGSLGGKAGLGIGAILGSGVGVGSAAYRNALLERAAEKAAVEKDEEALKALRNMLMDTDRKSYVAPAAVNIFNPIPATIPLSVLWAYMDNRSRDDILRKTREWEK